eukprot:2072781-Rhodomonas_salina.1
MLLSARAMRSAGLRSCMLQSGYMRVLGEARNQPMLLRLAVREEQPGNTPARPRPHLSVAQFASKSRCPQTTTPR